MVVYWNFLYKPKKQGQSELDALSRRLSFKLPIVVRYNIGITLVAGIVHSIIAGNSKWLKRYFLLIPFGMTFLCYDEIQKYLLIKKILENPLPRINFNKTEAVITTQPKQQKILKKLPQKQGKIQKIQF